MTADATAFGMRTTEPARDIMGAQKYERIRIDGVNERGIEALRAAKDRRLWAIGLGEEEK